MCMIFICAHFHTRLKPIAMSIQLVRLSFRQQCSRKLYLPRAVFTLRFIETYPINYIVVFLKFFFFFFFFFIYLKKRRKKEGFSFWLTAFVLVVFSSISVGENTMSALFNFCSALLKEEPLCFLSLCLLFSLFLRCIYIHTCIHYFCALIIYLLTLTYLLTDTLYVRVCVCMYI